jgi:hypothetical protein
MTGFVLSQGIPTDGLLLLNRLSRERHLPSPLLCQMFPARVARLDQYNLLLSSPALELFFPSDRIENLIKCFVVHQSLAMVLPRKAIDLTRFVLPYPPFDVVCDADIQSSCAARDDVRPIRMIHSRNAFDVPLVAFG